MIGVIYKVTNLQNGKIYIGQTIQGLSKRKMQHLNSKRKCAFHNALKEYGKDNFIWEIIEQCPQEVLNAREQYWIKYFNSYGQGYNETSGGDNAEGLLNWQKTHPEEVTKNAYNGLKKAQEWCKTHKKEHLEQLNSVRQKGIDATKIKVLNIDLNIAFDSLSDAEKWSLSSKNPNGKKASHQHIAHVCRGQRKTCGGYRWKYID